MGFWDIENAVSKGETSDLAVKLCVRQLSDLAVSFESSPTLDVRSGRARNATSSGLCYECATRDRTETDGEGAKLIEHGGPRHGPVSDPSRRE